MEKMQNDEMEIDLLELFYALKEKVFLILTVGLLWGCEITASTEKEDFSFKMNERSSFMLKLTCDENFNYKL